MKDKISILLLYSITLFAASCYSSKDAFDRSIVKHGIDKQQVIKELAEFAVTYAAGKAQNVFSTSALADKDIQRKFDANGLGGLITVTYKNTSNVDMYGLIDSTIVFKQTTLRGVTEIIYDFAAKERKFAEDKTNTKQYAFLSVANRIYYRRRPVPMM